MEDRIQKEILRLISEIEYDEEKLQKAEIYKEDRNIKRYENSISRKLDLLRIIKG